MLQHCRAMRFAMAAAFIVVFLPHQQHRCCSSMTTTPSPRRLRRLMKLPPHAGYHGAIAHNQQKTNQAPFFEGWYLRVVNTHPEQSSFAFIFHIFDPHMDDSPRRGVGMQIILFTPSSTTNFVAVEDSDTSNFQADSHILDLRNTFSDDVSFFELTSSRARGRASSSSDVEHHHQNQTTVVEFDFSILPQIGWGGEEGSRQYSTAGWLASFPIFEPHYQVLISKGTATGSITVRTDNDNEQHQKYDLQDAAVYLEKNWGGSFPSQWWWIQANTFGETIDLCVTSTGGRRRLPLVVQQEEDVALVGLHWNGEFLPFSTVDWNVKWGEWNIRGSYKDYTVKLTGTCGDDEGVRVKCPTLSGMKEIAFETFKGKLRVELFQKGQSVLDVTSTEACLEVGGGSPWARTFWTGESAMKEPLKSVVMNEDFERAGADLLQKASLFVEIPGL